MEFIPDHLHEVAYAIFMRRIQPAIDAIDARIKVLKKEAADLEGRRERLLFSIGGPVLEIRLSFPDSVDDDAVSSFFLLFSFSYYFTQYTYMFPIALVWRVFATFWGL